MLGLCIASLVLAQATPSAVVLVGSRGLDRRYDAEQWAVAGYRAEAAAEGLLRDHGYQILDPKLLPEFAPKSAGQAHESLRAALKSSGASVAVGIQVLSVNVSTPDPVYQPKEVTLSGKPIPARSEIPKPSVAKVTVRVWLLESGEVKPYVDGKTPEGYGYSYGRDTKLLGDASKQAITDVLRRFLRLRSPRPD